MKTSTNFALFGCATVFFVCTISGCAIPAKQDHRHSSLSNERTLPQNAYRNKENAVERYSDDNKYKVTLYSNFYPLPINKVHTWTAHIETASGEIVENAKVRIHGGMPAHKHGFPTKPRVNTYVGNGDYLIEGVKFSMPGEWEMRLNIREDKILRRDRVVFKIVV